MATKDGIKTGGRQKGTPNKADKNAREAIARFVDNNSERFTEWLEKIERENGAMEAFKCVTSLLEYHVPKLTRTDMSMSADVRTTDVPLTDADKKRLDALSDDA